MDDNFSQFQSLTEPKKTVQRKQGWASMNTIQKTGVIACFVFFAVSEAFSNKTYGAYIELGAQTALLFGWVAGSLWKVRHALHFWWSLFAASLGHLCLFSTYLRVDRYYEHGHHSGREVGTVIVGMIAVETVVFLILIKKIGMWVHQREHRSAPGVGL